MSEVVTNLYLTTKYIDVLCEIIAHYGFKISLNEK